MSGRHSEWLPCIVLFLMMGSVTGDEIEQTDGEQPSAASSDVAGVQYEDDFSSATGAAQHQVDGGDAVIEGEVHSRMHSFARLPFNTHGHLKLIMTEDNTVKNSDGESGVLRMEIAEVPHVPSILGFVYQGNETSGDISMPGWKGNEISLNDLNRAFITFRFRADNREDSNALGATFRLRFEPGVNNGHESGADFGSLIATSRWRTFRRPLASAENLQEFLEVVNVENPGTFRMVWSQANNLSSYHPGDALLVDDLRITIE